jgi:hypothetical protein
MGGKSGLPLASPARGQSLTHTQAPNRSYAWGRGRMWSRNQRPHVIALWLVRHYKAQLLDTSQVTKWLNQTHLPVTLKGRMKWTIAKMEPSALWDLLMKWRLGYGFKRVPRRKERDCDNRSVRTSNPPFFQHKGGTKTVGLQLARSLAFLSTRT